MVSRKEFIEKLIYSILIPLIVSVVTTLLIRK